MANLTESPIYESGIFQLEKSTPALGGAPVIDGGIPSAGHANAQAQQLANRTAYLKQQIEAIEDVDEGIIAQVVAARDAAEGFAITGLGYLEGSQAAALQTNQDKLDSADSADAAQAAADSLAFAVTDYPALRAYTGSATRLQVTATGISGVFNKLGVVGGYTDDGGITIIGVGGMVYVRDFQGSVNIKWFGAKGDGVTDDTTAIQAAFDAVNARGGGAVFIPTGVFRKADTAPLLKMYLKTTLFGLGESSVILHEDLPTNPRRDMLQVQPGVGGVSFRDFKIKGTVETYPVETNQSQCLTGDDFTSLFMQNVTIDGCRFMSTAFSRVHEAIVTGSRVRNSMRDGIRFTQSRNVKVIGNHFFKVADDCVALHSSDPRGDVFLPYNHVVADNTMEYSQGICCLGAKQLKIHGNNMRFMLRHPIRISSTSTLSEGNTPMFAISVRNNTIMDTLLKYNATDSELGIRIDVRERTGSAPKPGVGSPRFDYNWIAGPDFQAGIGINPGGWGIDVSDNIIARSYKGSGVWTDLGDGELLDRLGAFNPAGFYNPTITSTFFDIGGIRVNGPASGLTISGNNMFGLGVNAVVIKVGTGSSSGVYDNYSIHDNKIVDCPGIGIDLSMTSGLSRHVSVRNNVLDIDPFFRHSGHNADNTWTSLTSTTGILTGGAQSVGFADGNTFAHCAQIVDVPTRMSWGVSNVAIWQPNGGTGLDGTSTNRGIRYIPSQVKMVNVIYNGDPTDAAFKGVITQPAMQGSAMPSTGTYVYGHVTQASIPIPGGSAGSAYTVTGWRRLTTGTGHVLNTDWREMRSLTGT